MALKNAEKKKEATMATKGSLTFIINEENKKECEKEKEERTTDVLGGKIVLYELSDYLLSF